MTSHIDWREKRVSVRMLGAEGRWIVRSHVDWREERVPAKTLDPEGRWIGEANETFFRRVWNLSLVDAFEKP